MTNNIEVLRGLRKEAFNSDEPLRVAALDAALAALGGEQGWRAIETAPRDGTLVLVYFPTKGVRAVAWDSPWSDDLVNDGLWCVDDEKHGPYSFRGYSDNGPSAPTHWMPLPPPPTTQGADHDH